MTIDISGTSLQGWLRATRSEIEARLGAPEFDSPEAIDEDGSPADCTTEWRMISGDTVIAIYDVAEIDDESGYVRGPSRDEIYDWSIGGVDGKAVDVVSVLMGAERVRARL